MPFRRLAAIFLVAGLIGAGTACSNETPPPPTALTGVITQIAGSGGEVTGFDLRADGESYNILIDPGRDYGFDLNHLYEHESSGDPVRVRLRAQNETLYALQIDDA